MQGCIDIFRKRRKVNHCRWKADKLMRPSFISLFRSHAPMRQSAVNYSVSSGGSEVILEYFIDISCPTDTNFSADVRRLLA